MSNVFNLIFGNQKAPEQEGAWKAMKAFRDTMNIISCDGIIKTVELKNERLTRLVENDPKSPILINIDDDKKLIYYPENSTPYQKPIAKWKYIRVIDGCIYDELSNKTLKAGDRLTISPYQNYRPHTKDCKAIVEVTFSDSKEKLETICGL